MTLDKLIGSELSKRVEGMVEGRVRDALDEQDRRHRAEIAELRARFEAEMATLEEAYR